MNLTNATIVNPSILVILQTSYTASGVYRTKANISSVNLVDNRTGWWSREAAAHLGMGNRIYCLLCD